MLDRSIPAICDGGALKDGLEEDCNSQPQDDETDKVGSDSEVAGVENAHVEEEEGQFGRCHC